MVYARDERCLDATRVLLDRKGMWKPKTLTTPYLTLSQVYKLVPALQAAKNLTNPSNDNSTPPDGTVIATPREQNATSTPPTGTSDSAVSRSWRYLIRGMKVVIELFRFYFKHSACLPSFSLAILYLTVLSFGGQMVTYLIAAGFNSFYIALVRTLSVVFEISATWIAPRLMARIGAARAGMWFLSWQMLWLGATVSFFWGST